MKKLIALAVVASAFASFAEDNVFGCLAIESSAEETIICVPWLQPGATSDDSSIKVTDVIKTSNLQENDILYYYADGAYKAWLLDSNKNWVYANIVDENGKVGGVSALAGDDEKTLKRGNAVLLKRPKSDRAGVIYVYGQVATTTTASVSMANGTESAWAFTLIAPPAVTDTALNSGKWSGTIGKNDMIVIDGQLPFRYEADHGGWCHKTVTADKTGMNIGYTDTTASIPAGQGAWYISTGGSDVTWNWTDLPSTTGKAN